MDGKTREAIRIAKQYIQELRKTKIRLTRAYLYGSYANGSAHRDSDIDIVVVSPQLSGDPLLDELESMRIRLKVELRISSLADRPQEFSEDHPIPYETITNGKRIA